MIVVQLLNTGLQTVKRNSQFYELPLHILSYNDLYQGWTMDRVVQETGKKGNCKRPLLPATIHLY